MSTQVTGENTVMLPSHMMGYDFQNLLPGSSKSMALTINVPEPQPGMGGQWKVSIEYTAGQPTGWLSLDRESGPFHNGPQVIHATANAKGLAMQDPIEVPYTAILTFSSVGGNNVQVHSQIPVSVYISEAPFHNGGPKVPPPPPTLLVGLHNGGHNITLDITNDRENLGPIKWQLTSLVNWITIPQAMATGKLEVGKGTTIQAQIPGNVNLPSGVHKTDLHLSFTYDPPRHMPEWVNTTTAFAHVELTVP